jgi:hypothetical protein
MVRRKCFLTTNAICSFNRFIYKAKRSFNKEVKA